MVEYRDQANVNDRTSSTGRVFIILAIAAALIVGLLFATGFWEADVKGGALPDVDVSATGGEMPNVDVDSKEVVVGTKKETIDVPTVGVKDDGND